ncbi:hypothetical protein E4T44_05686 [Aureobasidium sp. EXF-8845]|nr:hypothetical protein E4T44_05686 [Aureobasidium sp. EXF-8845]KAI4850151.1 hypothetical protein E4T45_05622 [Aureobasidium sp. EXF-8846]
MGWKDILRPIRDGLRDNLPSKQPHHDPEDERRCREDVLKGFTYFDSFQGINDWRPEQAYSFQRANTPLLPRPTSSTIKGHARITLIHDFSGGYHDYEDIHSPLSDLPSYSCEYMQAIDTFVYFSHKLVCVPPPSWTNALHRNGVKVLGTFLVEPQSIDMVKILQRTSSETLEWEYTLASQLTHIARFYGFDGWLINIEKTFPITDWDLSKLEGFLKQLGSSFDDGCVIWYDSLTRKNRIDYQNALTEQNVILVKAAGSVLTNYVWTPETAVATRIFALRNNIDPANILCGIDVWAQSSERETYPRDIGGGTGTGLGVAKLAELGLSAGIFGPAWPYEHFGCPQDSRAVEMAMWTGAALPDKLRCDCASKSRHSIQGYMNCPILQNALEFPAGSDAFFYTDFNQAFEAVTGIRVRANLISQSVLPRPSIHSSTQNDIFSQVESCPSRLSLYIRAQDEVVNTQRTLSLFKLSVPASEGLLISVKYRKAEVPSALHVRLHLEGLGIRMPLVEQQKTVTTEIRANEADTLTGISLRVEGHVETISKSPLLVAEIMSICVRRRSKAARNYTISNATLVELDETTSCLSWKLNNEASNTGPTDDGLPFSSLTGPFSFFTIEINTQQVGRAYALEYVLRDVYDGSDVRITGVGFDDEIICVYTGTLRKQQRRGSTESWQLV